MIQQEPKTLFPWLSICYEIAIYFSINLYMPALPHISAIFHNLTPVNFDALYEQHLQQQKAGNETKQ